MSLSSELESLASKTQHYSSDSRNVGTNSLFIALKGENLDGTNFVEGVLSKGEQNFAIVQKSPEAERLKTKYKDRVLVCENAQAAHRSVAGHFRKKFKGKIIAVAGSNGKTSTKDFLFQLLSSKFKVKKTLGSQNGHLGIPKSMESLFSIDGSSPEIMVLEVGIDAPGDMTQHAQLVSPDYCLISSIGEEHLNLLHNLDNVFQEERVIADITFARGGKVFVPESDVYLKKLVDEGVAEAVSGEVASRFQKSLSFNQPHFISNLSLCIQMAQTLGMSEQEYKSEFPNLRVPKGRGELKEHNAFGKSIWVYEDYYNANFNSMCAGIEYAISCAKDKDVGLHVVLGDMFDQGEAEASTHKRVLEYIVDSGVEHVTLVGERFSKAAQNFPKFKTYPTVNELVAHIKEVFSEEGLYLVKGSRGMKMEQVIESLAE